MTRRIVDTVFGLMDTKGEGGGKGAVRECRDVHRYWSRVEQSRVEHIGSLIGGTSIL